MLSCLISFILDDIVSVCKLSPPFKFEISISLLSLLASNLGSTLETTDKKDNSANVKVIRNIEDDKPTPKPRPLKVISDASDISPSNYMEVDSDLFSAMKTSSFSCFLVFALLSGSSLDEFGSLLRFSPLDKYFEGLLPDFGVSGGFGTNGLFFKDSRDSERWLATFKALK
jgi:hypothetical protein